MYFFIIYEHGLKHCEEITNILSNKFTIKRMVNLNIRKNHMLNFFFKYLYKNENHMHISNKIKYLFQLNKNNMFKMNIYMVCDKNEVFFNDRGTKKNLNIELIKRTIRNKFNPKFYDKNLKIFPLEKGVSHNHIVHSNDVPEEYNIIIDILKKYKKYKIYKVDTYHHKNEEFLNMFINKYHIPVYNLNDAEIILSAGTKITTHPSFKNKKFIFGPHFGKNRINQVQNIDNTYNNNIYIQPSEPSVKLWLDELKFKNMPVKAIPFGVNTNKFKPNIINNILNNSNIILYYKDRNPEELKILEMFLKNNNINYRVFSYLKRYSEDDFLAYLKTCKYGIWLGCHESQGFALEETLSCNVPLLVWNVTLRKQQWSHKNTTNQYKTHVSSIPYWDERCGEFFYDASELKKTFELFISKINTYKPREFIIQNLSQESCSEKWNHLLSEL